MIEQKSISRIIAIHLVAILFVILNVSNVKIAGISNIIPLFDLMMIFYFAVFQSVFSIWFLFLLGIWSDAVNGNPLGVTALCYIVLTKLFYLLNRRLIIKENFKQIWKQFFAFCSLFLSMKWLMLSAFHGLFYSPINSIVQLALSSMIYVVMHKFFDYLNANSK